MASDGDRGDSGWQRYGRTLVLLLVFFLAALLIRSYFNFDASYNDGDFVWSGTDGYYHMRVIDHLRETGEFLLHDPLINYPIGATNPRPPFFDWTIGAVGGLLSPFFGGDAELATDYVAAFSPAIWGALTVFPVYFLGREAFGHKAGLWAAFLVAVMAAHISRSNLGALDHDATILFFFTLGAYYFAKALNLMRHRVYVEDYRRVGAIGTGWRDFYRTNQASVAYAALTGAAWGGIALTWKGFPYVFAVFAVWYGFQLLANHLRRTDSTPYFLLSLVPFVVTLLMIWPYYSVVGRVDSAVMPAVGILVGMLLASAIFVPTRHLPPVLVLPITAAGIALALVVMLVVLPAIGQIYFTGLGYFVQNKLYTTIAEAQRTPIGYLVFATGVIPFFFALAGIVLGIVSFVKRRRDDHLFVLVWATVGLLMAFTATRFVFNASVGFALLAGWVTARFVAWIRFGEVGKVWRSVRSAGYGVFKSGRQAVGVRHTLAAIFIVFALLLPNVWLGVDAGVPQEYVRGQTADLDRDSTEYEFWTNWFGAFGQDFLSGHWQETLAWLQEQDADVPAEDRPAFMAWWDYGFYAAQRGEHPAVADPFQFGYEISGRVLASQSESEAILFMSIRLLEGNVIRGDTTGAFDPDVAAVMNDVEPGLAAQVYQPLRSKGYDEAYDVLRRALTPDGETTVPTSAAVDFYSDVMGATGKSIRYLAIEGRMFPCDDPRSQGIDSGSIFYAPVYLADKNPEDFVRTKYQDGSGGTYYQRVYVTTPDNGSEQLDDPYIVDLSGNRYIVSGGQLYPRADNGFIDYSDPQHATPIALASAGELEYSDAFYNSLLYRAWIGPSPSNPADKIPPPTEYAPGSGLEHFRVVYSTVPTATDDNQNRCNLYSQGVIVLKYFEGAPVTGTVRDSSGAPMEDITVQVTDNFGIPHARAQTDASGEFALSAPFSTDVAENSGRAAEDRPGRLSGVGANQVQVVVNGDIVASENFSVTDEQAMRGGAAIPAFSLTVELGTLEGIVFHDMDGDGAHNATSEPTLANVEVTLGDRNTTTDGDGRYSFANVRPGLRDVSASHPDYTATTNSVSVPPGGSASLDLGVTPRPIPVSGVLTHNGEAVDGAPVRFNEPITPDVEQPDSRQSPPSNADGNYTMNLPPGTWEVSVEYQTIEDGQTVRYFTTEATTLEIAIGNEDIELDLQLEREVVTG